MNNYNKSMFRGNTAFFLSTVLTLSLLNACGVNVPIIYGNEYDPGAFAAPTPSNATVNASQSATASKDKTVSDIAAFTVADSDGDGINDTLDKCPETPPFAGVNLSGCPLDTDGDNVADYIDKCRGTPRGVEVDTRGCGLDDDHDGVPNHRDRCPDTPQSVNVGGWGCEWDSDNDGVVDSKDLCLGTPPGVKVEYMGCHVIEIVTLRGVHFLTGSDDLSKNAREVLSSMAKSLKENPKMRVEIAGHTDNTGSGVINKELSTRRAEAAHAFLVNLGVSKNVLSTHGYADTQPVASNDSDEGRSLNRRVELRIVEID